jgi:hypothetical protein
LTGAGTVTSELESDEIRVPARAARWPWVVVVVAGVVAAASTVSFWLNRPGWGYCVDGDGWGYCDEGVFSSNAIAGSAIVAVALVGLIVTAALARGPRQVRIVLIATTAFAVLMIAAWVLQLVTLEEVPIPSDPQNGPD